MFYGPTSHIVSPKVPTTLETPNSYPMGHHIHSFVSKNGRKRLKTGFCQYLLPWPLISHTRIFMGQRVVLNYCMVSLKVPSTLMTPYSYPMDHMCYQKCLNIVEKHVFGNDYIHNLLFCTQNCSMCYWAVSYYVMISPNMPLTHCFRHCVDHH
jgi:hypothetical protein